MREQFNGRHHIKYRPVAKMNRRCEAVFGGKVQEVSGGDVFGIRQVLYGIQPWSITEYPRTTFPLIPKKFVEIAPIVRHHVIGISHHHADRKASLILWHSPIFHHVVCDAVDFGCFGRDYESGMLYEFRVQLQGHLRVPIEKAAADLDDAILLGVESRGFNVKKSEFHQSNSSLDGS